MKLGALFVANDKRLPEFGDPEPILFVLLALFALTLLRNLNSLTACLPPATPEFGRADRTEGEPWERTSEASALDIKSTLEEPIMLYCLDG